MQRRHNGVRSTGGTKRSPLQNKHSWDTGFSAQSPPVALSHCPYLSPCRKVLWDALGHGPLHSKELENDQILENKVFSALPSPGSPPGLLL